MYVLKRVEKVLKGKHGIEDRVGVKQSKEYGCCIYREW
jgi:hypothetical protein